MQVVESHPQARDHPVKLATSQRSDYRARGAPGQENTSVQPKKKANQQPNKPTRERVSGPNPCVTTCCRPCHDPSRPDTRNEARVFGTVQSVSRQQHIPAARLPARDPVPGSHTHTRASVSTVTSRRAERTGTFHPILRHEFNFSSGSPAAAAHNYAL